uniref:PTS system mannose/fructose/sorbose family transporter subunit IID n=1 Tax=Ndongobacter massiliensis TaxID=1871025 RepID=UPI0009314647|nr:PTS system mannose/fructose/sorbose family transporter subunit IID [Ndongobacter massiliensis]
MTEYAEKETNMLDKKTTPSGRLLTDADLRRSYWAFEVWAQACCSYERLQAPGFFMGMRNVIHKFYKDQKEERIEACQRHMEFYNSEFALVGPVILGLTISLEEQKKAGQEIDGSMISAIKTSLMGPLAGIGDTLRQGTLIPIIGSIAISLGVEGNLFAPIFYMVATLGLNFGISYFLFKKSYFAGREFVSEFFRGNKMERIMTGVTAMGAITIGALASGTVKAATPLSIQLGENVLEIQQLIDKILPNLLPLIVVFLTLHLLNKKMSVNKVLGLMIVASIVLGFFGVL